MQKYYFMVQTGTNSGRCCLTLGQLNNGWIKDATESRGLAERQGEIRRDTVKGSYISHSQLNEATLSGMWGSGGQEGRYSKEINFAM
jgi:hypothetical protein